jgi:hypothetical protein
MKRKWLAVGIILLFIGVTIAPTITFTTVKAANENDLVEITTQTCGIKGFEDTTVKLTRQQYQELEQYLIDFRARLNQTTTKEEAVPIFIEAVVELNNYGLLPKGMNVEQAQRLVTGWYQKPIERLLNNRHQEIFPNLNNIFCLLYLHTTRFTDYALIFMIINPLMAILLLLRGILPPDLLAYVFSIAWEIAEKYPLKLFNFIWVDGYSDFFSFGLRFPRVKTHDPGSPLLLGYTGLMLQPSNDEAYFIGFALAVLYV